MGQLTVSVTLLVGDVNFGFALFFGVLVDKELFGAYVDELERLSRMY